MKILLLLCSVLVGFLSLSAQNSDTKTGLKNDFPQTVSWSYWDDGWHGEKIVTFSYNPLGFPLSEVWDLTEGPDVKFTYAYSSDNQYQTMKLRQEKNGGIWTNISRQRTEYDTNGRATLMVVENYTGGVWMIGSGFQYQPEYLDGRLYQETISSFDPGDGYFHPAFKWTYTWDESGRAKTQTCENFSETGVWVFAVRNSFFWDHDSKLDYLLSDIWRVNEWVPYSKEMHTYYGLENHTESLYIWREDLDVYTAWQRLVNEYDERSNLILSTIEEWKGIGWQVSSGSGYNISYVNSHAAERITNRWDPGAPEGGATGGKWIVANREIFSDFISLQTNDISIPAAQLHCYPNPASNILFVDLSYDCGTAAELLVSDVQGRVLIKQKTFGSNFRTSVSVSQLPPGVYWLTLTSGMHPPQSQKIIIQ